MAGPGNFKNRLLSIDGASGSTLLSIDSKRFSMLPGAPSIDSKRFLMLLGASSIDCASSSTLLSIDSKRFLMLPGAF